eukprot:2167544-Prymnesium_polylepis.1
MWPNSAVSRRFHVHVGGFMSETAELPVPGVAVSRETPHLMSSVVSIGFGTSTAVRQESGGLEAMDLHAATGLPV